jgi:hypothetical protein
MLQNAQAAAYHADMLRTQAQRDANARLTGSRTTPGRGLSRRLRRAR